MDFLVRTPCESPFRPIRVESDRLRARHVRARHVLAAGLLLALVPCAPRLVHAEDPPAQHASVEDEIQRELQRQEELLRQIDNEATTRDASRASIAPSEDELAARTDPRSAPPAPRLRDLPNSVFDEKFASIPEADGKGKRSVIARSLDADRDGKPEEVRYLDEKSKQLLRVDEDRDYDGRIDVWILFENGAPVARDLDENGDGKPDAWERYANGRMTSRAVDRDGNGARDAFYTYQGDALIEERHDTKGNGSIDRIVHYSGRHLTSTEEDRDGNGAIDTWSNYGLDGRGREVVVRVERDTGGDGKPDSFESFEQQDDKTVLVRREEDKNQDGTPDVISIYDKGKLVKKEINDPSVEQF
jgi:hypothetical protein